MTYSTAHTDPRLVQYCFRTCRISSQRLCASLRMTDLNWCSMVVVVEFRGDGCEQEKEASEDAQAKRDVVQRVHGVVGITVTVPCTAAAKAIHSFTVERCGTNACSSTVGGGLYTPLTVFLNSGLSTFMVTL